jgi:hypothetical protein
VIDGEVVALDENRSFIISVLSRITDRATTFRLTLNGFFTTFDVFLALQFLS